MKDDSTFSGVTEAAEKLDVSEDTVYALVDEDAIASIRAGRTILIPGSELRRLKRLRREFEVVRNWTTALRLLSRNETLRRLREDARGLEVA